jgi:hypothetical protein
MGGVYLKRQVYNNAVMARQLRFAYQKECAIIQYLFLLFGLTIHPRMAMRQGLRPWFTKNPDIGSAGKASGRAPGGRCRNISQLMLPILRAS